MSTAGRRGREREGARERERGRERPYRAARRRTTSLTQAAERVLDEVEPFGGRGGLIALNNQGDVIMPFQTMLMYRGVFQDGQVQVGIGPEFIQS